MNPLSRRLARGLLVLALCTHAGLALAADRIAVVSTRMVLERKFSLLESAARTQGVELAWTQVDVEGEAGVRRVLDGARFVLIDAPRVDDQALVERIAGQPLRAAGLPGVGIHVMSPPSRVRALGIDATHAQRIFEYYVGGTHTNHERLFGYLRAMFAGTALTDVAPPIALPDGGIYHPGHEHAVFGDLPSYLAWWERRTARRWRDAPVIGVEISSSYLSDGQTRMLDETVQAIEAHGALPLVFYRASRVARARSDRPRSGGAATDPFAHPGFPNPLPTRGATVAEPLITLDGEVLVQVMLVDTFLGIDPESRKAWHRAMDVPALQVLAYRGGTRADYLADSAGISRFHLPFTLTNAEYIGLQDPVVVTANEAGELVPMAEQMRMLVGKAVNLARLRSTPNADKRLALFFWNHPPGETSQGASNLNVPRSIEHLVRRLREHGYDVDATRERALVDAAAQMLQPSYRPGSLPALMKTPHWDFLPLAQYERWYAALPAQVRKRIDDSWGPPAASPWIARHDGVRGFVVPRMKLGRLVVLPQPMRSETAAGPHDEKKLFHDTKTPLNHFYLAVYLWAREQHRAHAIVHFGTHGTQEWTPGKERGLWAWDEPNLLVGDTPVVYPYIVDNIGEAVHVKRRGRGVLVSHQTPAFAPAGLSGDFVRMNDLVREYRALEEGLVRERSRRLVVEQARRMRIPDDLGWAADAFERDFDQALRAIEDYLEELGASIQPLGLHTLGEDAEREHAIGNVVQMLGDPLYARVGVRDAKSAFGGDYRQWRHSAPFRFVDETVFGDRPLESIEDAPLRELAVRGRRLRESLRADVEIESVLRALAGRWIDPSYGGDPIRNPDALPTGRNLYGFDPSRIPTRAAWEAGRKAIDELVDDYRAQHGRIPHKLAFTMWSTETMRHLGVLEAQVFYAMGVMPVWDVGGRVVGLEPIAPGELGRPRIDVVISLTGLYRDQFPNLIERFNEAVALLGSLDEAPQANFVKANTERIRRQLLARGVEPDSAREYAATRVFGNESGDYGTRLPAATLASDTWNRDDGKLESLYLARMSWAYGPDPAHWSRKLRDAEGAEINAYAEHLRGTSAAVFSRSSNLRGLLDTDHPFEYLGGISMAVRNLDGKSPALYVSNLRDPQRARLATASRFLATELRSVYQHPRWIAEMQKEGYAGTLQMLNAVNNFWGWQVVDRGVVRDDQWQAFHEAWIRDRHRLGLRRWFESANPAAFAQIAERMLEAIRKGYWRTDERTERELVQAYESMARRHDVHTANDAFREHVRALARGYGLDASKAGSPVAARTPPSAPSPAPPAPPPPAIEPPATERPAEQPRVRGQELREVQRQARVERLVWSYAGLIAFAVFGGAGFQAWRTWRDRGLPGPAH